MNRPQKAIQALPHGYNLRETLDLSKNMKIGALLSLASLGLFVVFGMIFLGLLHFLRPDITLFEGQFTLVVSDLGTFIIPLLVFFGVIITMVFLHEAIHGLFFRIFTGGSVKFGFKGAYAYAAAPDWYIPKNPYLLVSLAPLLIITILGIAVLLVVPTNWILPVLLLITMNGSGAAGDIYVFIWLHTKPDDVLIQDYGDRMLVYAPGEKD